MDSNDQLEMEFNKPAERSWLRKILKVSGIILILILCVLSVLAWMNREMLSNILFADEIEGSVTALPNVEQELIPVQAGADDWPRWRGVNSDGIGKSMELADIFNAGLQQRWSIDYLCQGATAATWSAPVVYGRHVIVLGREDNLDLVFCIDRENGRLLWRQSYEASTGSSYGKGPRATPCIDGSEVFTFGRGGHLRCWNLADGKCLWKASVHEHGGEEPKWGHSSSPLVIDGKVIVAGGGDARIQAFDRHSGKLLWSNGKGPAGYAAIGSARIADNSVILHFHGTGLSAHAIQDGKELWNYSFPTNYEVNATSPVVSGDKVFITGGYGAGCALLHMQVDKVEVIWSGQQIAAHHSDPVVIGDHLYGYSGQSWKNVGAFVCLEFQSGDIRWTTDTIGNGTLFAAGDEILALDLKGNATVLRADPSGYQQLAEIPELLSKVKRTAWTAPVIANGDLFLRYKERLICFSLNSSVNNTQSN